MKTNKGGKKILWLVVIVALLLAGGGLAIHNLGRGYQEVLYHYIFADFNVAKLRSAVFLIDNLDYHNTEIAEYSLSGEQLAFKARTDSICTALCEKHGWNNVPMDCVYAERGASASWIEHHLKDNESKGPELRPCRTAITSESLIRQIDLAYDLWQTSPFAQGLSFDEYKESILPFVCIRNYGEFHSLDYYRGAVPSLSEMADIKTSRERADCYAKIIMYLREINASIGKMSSKGIMSLYSRDEDCLDIAHCACMIMRSFGMPMAVDHVVGFRELPDRHYFCSLYDVASRRWQGFNPEGSLPGDSDFMGTPALNVYRDMFGAQKDAPYFIRAKGEYVPSDLASPCLRDVSELYFPTAQITLPFNAYTSNNLAYLSAFNSRGQDGLVVSTWGKINKSGHSVTYNNVLTNTLYFPMYYNGDTPVYFGKPFYVKINKGKTQVCYLQSKDASTAKTNLLLLRKYPVKKNMRMLAERMKGSVILGSNDETFSKADTLLRLATAPPQYLRTYRLDHTGNYRYYRFLAPSEYPHANVSHMEWLVPKKQNDKETFTASREGITGPSQIPGSAQTRYCQLRDAVLNDMGTVAEYDHNPLTSAGAYPHITLRLSKPRKVEAINLMPTHANNTITPGHRYLLLYWDGRWKVCGQATAKYEYVEFRNVPSDKLYWLYDTTDGQEEMPFIVSKGKQRFLYGDLIE